MEPENAETIAPVQLPVPPLEQTIDRYLERIMPLLCKEEYASCKKPPVIL